MSLFYKKKIKTDLKSIFWLIHASVCLIQSFLGFFKASLAFFDTLKAFLRPICNKQGLGCRSFIMAREHKFGEVSYNSEIVILVDNWRLNYRIIFYHQVCYHKDILTKTVGSVVNIFFSKHCKYLKHLSNCSRHLD